MADTFTLNPSDKTTVDFLFLAIKIVDRLFLAIKNHTNDKGRNFYVSPFFGCFFGCFLSNQKRFSG